MIEFKRISHYLKTIIFYLSFVRIFTHNFRGSRTTDIESMIFVDKIKFL